MDFSKRGVKNKEHQVKSTSKRLNSKFRIALFRLALACFVFACIVGVYTAYGAIKGMIDNAPELDQINIDPEGFTTHVYYSDGTLSETLIGAEANRVLVTIDEIPDVLEHCFVAVEDERFYEHDGIDVRGIFRAGFSVIKTKGLGFGASTITQQLLKNKAFGGGDEESNIDKIIRKVQEQYLAVKLEDKFSKDEIMEAYLNNINLGNGSFGVQTAAQSYFGKNVQDLTLSESAVIAAIALSPVYRNPIRYPEKNAERREACLEKMLELGYCTPSEYEAAMKDDVYSRISLFSSEKETSSYYTYFTDHLINQVLSDLQTKKGYTQLQAENLLYSGGLDIYTTQDRSIQEIVDKYFTEEANFPEIGKGSYYELNYAISIETKDGETVHYHIEDLLEYFKDYDDSDGKYKHQTRTKKGISKYGYDSEDMYAKAAEYKEYVTSDGSSVLAETCKVIIQPQTSMTILEQSTGNVVALYGGRGEKTGKRTLNRATDSVRQVGSTFKVLASFLPALDTSGMTLASVFDDSEYFYPAPNQTTQVQNWNVGVYKGLSSIREGIYNSMNIVACRAMEIVTPSVGFDYLKKLGFSTLVDSEVGADGKTYSDKNISLALGGLTRGVTNLELTAAYASIANSGIYNSPIVYTKVVDHNGKVLLSNETTSTQVMKTSTSWLLTNAMEDTVNRGTGTRLRFRDYPMSVAGKTGTAHDYVDLWFAGFTPYYTSAIWTGFDGNYNQEEKVYHQNLWRNIMEEIHASLKLENKAFPKPDSITTATICSKCGNLAVPGLCENALGGSTVRTEYFAKGTVPTETCSCHVKASICKDSGHLASPYCPIKSVEEQVFLIKEELPESKTWDTPNILPTGENAKTCTLHGAFDVTPGIPETPENDIVNDYYEDFFESDDVIDDTPKEEAPFLPPFVEDPDFTQEEDSINDTIINELPSDNAPESYYWYRR